MRDPTLTVAGISDCKRALDALAIDFTGATVFCPRNSVGARRSVPLPLD